jgi:hypothetical protein
MIMDSVILKEGLDPTIVLINMAHATKGDQMLTGASSTPRSHVGRIAGTMLATGSAGKSANPRSFGTELLFVFLTQKQPPARSIY